MLRATLVALPVAALAALACGQSRGTTPTHPDAGDASGAMCQAATLVLAGTTLTTPHGNYAISNIVFTTAAFSATLPVGGSVALSWSGDATRGPVPVAGTINLPSEEEGPPVPWCLMPRSTVMVNARGGTLELQVRQGTAEACTLQGDGGVAVEGCFELG